MKSRSRCAASILFACLFLVLLASTVRAAEGAAEAAGILEKLAEQKFGTLSRAELLVVRAAPMRDLVWLGPNSDPVSPDNRAVDGDKWGPDRTVRAEVVRWLAADPGATPYVHPSGIGFAAGRIAGAIDLSYLQVPKPITMLGCYIPAGLDLSYSHLQGIDIRRSATGPVSGDYSDVVGDVTMLQGHYGAVSLFRAHVSGSLDFIGAHVSNPAGDSVLATEASIGGDADFHQGFTTDGIVDFRFAKIGHSLSFNDAHFEGAAENGLDAGRATIAGMLYWVRISHTPRTILDLSNARAEGIGDDASSWPAPGNLNVDGFVYGTIVDGPIDSDARLRWLALQAPGYKPQPFGELAKVLAAEGNDEGATTVMIAQRNARRDFGNLSFPERMWSLIQSRSATLPAFSAMVDSKFVTFGAILFRPAALKIVTLPEAGLIRLSETGNGRATTNRSTHLPSLRTLPVVELHQGECWRPNPTQSK